MKNRSLTFWLFLLPTILSLGVVIVIPFLGGLFFSLTDWDGLAFNEFVGLSNYISLFKSKDFLHSLWFTIKIAFVLVIIINAFGLGLALLVTRKLKSSNFLRTIFFMPNLIGGLILGFIWQFIFVNVFQDVGKSLNIEGLQGWLSTTDTGFWGIVILTCWQMAGYIMVIYIAYIQNIPKELLESAEIDGASAWQRVRHIIFPLVAPAFTVSMFLTLSNAFQIYDQNLSLTDGGPHESTKMLAMDIVRTAYSQNEMAFAQAKGVIFFIIVSVVALTQVYYNKKREVDM